MKKVYFQKGTPSDNPELSTDKCSTCVTVTMTSVNDDALTFDTERDADVTWNACGKFILQTVGATVWKCLWESFSCGNEKCSNKSPCGKRPTYIECGAEKLESESGSRWTIYVSIAREIECCDGEPPHDESPEFPDVGKSSIDLPIPKIERY